MPNDLPKLLSLRIIYRSGDPIHPLVTCFDLPKNSKIIGKGYDFHIQSLEGVKKLDVQCYALTSEGEVLSRLCDSKLSKSEARMICDHLNKYWQNQARNVVLYLSASLRYTIAELVKISDSFGRILSS